MHLCSKCLSSETFWGGGDKMQPITGYCRGEEKEEEKEERPLCSSACSQGTGAAEVCWGMLRGKAHQSQKPKQKHTVLLLLMQSS